MPRHAGGFSPRRLLWLAAALALVLGTVAFLRLGLLFYRQDPLVAVDAVIPLAGSEMDRQLEAADLYKAGFARYIVLTRGHREQAVELLEERGIHVPDPTEIARDAFVQFGIPREAVIIPPLAHDNTAHEAQTLTRLAREHGWRHLLVVTSRFHTRRAGFAFRRAMQGTGIEVSVRSTRYDTSDPEHWWRTRENIRWVLSEGPKFLAYVFGLRE